MNRKVHTHVELSDKFRRSVDYLINAVVLSVKSDIIVEHVESKDSGRAVDKTDVQVIVQFSVDKNVEAEFVMYSVQEVEALAALLTETAARIRWV